MATIHIVHNNPKAYSAFEASVSACAKDMCEIGSVA